MEKEKNSSLDSDSWTFWLFSVPFRLWLSVLPGPLPRTPVRHVSSSLPSLDRHRNTLSCNKARFKLGSKKWKHVQMAEIPFKARLSFSLYRKCKANHREKSAPFSRIAMSSQGCPFGSIQAEILIVEYTSRVFHDRELTPFGSSRGASTSANNLICVYTCNWYTNLFIASTPGVSILHNHAYGSHPDIEWSIYHEKCCPVRHR